MRRVFESMYRERLRTFKRYGYDMVTELEAVLDMIGPEPGSVLEIGSGRGHTALGLAGRGVRFTTVDLDPEALRATRGLLRETGARQGVFIKQMDAEHLLFKDGAFDLVVSVNFLHHARNPKRCIKEMVRVARNRVIIADLNRRGEVIMDRVHGLDGRTHERSRISFEEIKAYLVKSGLAVTTRRLRCQTVMIARKGDT